MNVLVVGGAGYIGSHVVRALLDRGHAVTVYDNLSTGCRENLFPEARFIEGDILDAEATTAAMQSGVDAFVHLAALKAAGESMEAPERYALNNISGTISLVNAACRARVGIVVFSSSAAVYGEPAYVPVDERHRLEPANFYGHTKLAIEQLLGWYDRLKGIRFGTLRYFNAAGYDPEGRIRGLERNPANLLPTIMEVAVGLRPRLEIFGGDYETPDGTCIRDYVHVTDLADAHIRALDRLSAGAESFTVNLGGGEGRSVKEVLELARTITGRPIPSVVSARRPGDPARLVSSFQAARTLLGWEPRNSGIETLVRTTWRAYERVSGRGNTAPGS